MDEQMRAFVVAVVRNEETGWDRGRSDRVVGVQGFEQLGGLSAFSVGCFETKTVSTESSPSIRGRRTCP